MSVFKLPMWVIHEIDKTRRNFLWKKNEQDRKGIPLANWELVCKPKKFGGLGILDIQTFNDALLAKWYWYWVKPETRLWKSVFQSVFHLADRSELPDGRFFKENIYRIVPFCDNCMRRELGNGKTVKFWTDRKSVV